MKNEIHPPYQDILFVDSSTGMKFVCGSTLQPTATEEFEGKTYPVYRVSVSSSSHPFFTGSKQFIDTEGRVEKFTKRFQRKREEIAQAQEKEREKKSAPEQKKKKTVRKKATS
ncbi:MAG: type B 50S ribosomal protein L31 [Parachlamydiales bacterium]|nr:type B 50S ribosomal protein L31 [Parachlamydiales bacterium]